ncbi:serologically defined colon cancer antigen 8 isoform X3 [Suricata suricatta]|uniref:serologically defined colon cancer antigen 8 isoform X3 n=1 Tax=Suricata suricatta TaxID=37032 RepID=UPI001155B8CB|nr:serologically defined colon cancer antigen 8 isoform X3 [Suricata suricatta]
MRASGWEGPPTSSDRDSILPNDSSDGKPAGATLAPRPLVTRGATLDTSLRNSHLWVPSPCMAKSPENSTLEEILGQYQRSLRERANRSIHQLKCALREGDGTVGEDAGDPTFSPSVESEDARTTWHELRHSHAVNQLKALLSQQATKESEVSPLRRRKVSPLRVSEEEEANMPTIHNLVPIINDQSQYIHHLEAEVKFCKEELSGMKNRVQVVVLENERLQQELKSQRQEEAMREQTLLDASENMQNSWITTGEDSGVDKAAKRRFSHGRADIVNGAYAGEAEKWKLELERLKLTYEQKSEVLESQLRVLRKDLAEYQKNCEDLKGRLKHKESLLAANTSNRAGGLCLKCAQHEAVLSQTHNNVHMQTIERLTKERDDLMSALVSVRSSLADMRQREAGAYEQVKHAMLVAEEASFEKTKALIQCEQLKNELERQKERLEKELASQQEKRASEKEMMKKKMTEEREAVESKILSLSQNIAQLEVQVEKATREKISAINQLEEIQNQLASKEMDVTKVCGEMRYQLNKTKMEKDEAEKEHREYRTKTKRDLEMKDQEIEKLRLEVSESKQHLEREQQKAAGAREECLELTDLLSESQHQLHLTRSEIAQLSQEKRYTYDRLEKLQRRNEELEEQCVQHGRLHEIMKQRHLAGGGELNKTPLLSSGNPSLVTVADKPRLQMGPRWGPVWPASVQSSESSFCTLWPERARAGWPGGLGARRPEVGPPRGRHTLSDPVILALTLLAAWAWADNGLLCLFSRAPPGAGGQE